MTNHLPQTSGENEAIILIKAAPQVSHTHGETVCCAGVDTHRNWLRLYPISFRELDESQKFKRWDKISFKWRLPKDDQRHESRRIDQHSIKRVGKLSHREKSTLIEPLIVTSLEKEYRNGNSLALLKADDIKFFYEVKSGDEFNYEKKKFDELARQTDMFSEKNNINIEPCPYRFKYKYKTDDGNREGTCQDWEIEATYYRWSKKYGENEALNYILKTFGEEYPQKGMLFAMGTHSRYPKWLINGVIRMDDIQQPALI